MSALHYLEINTNTGNVSHVEGYDVYVGDLFADGADITDCDYRGTVTELPEGAERVDEPGNGDYAAHYIA